MPALDVIRLHDNPLDVQAYVDAYVERNRSTAPRASVATNGPKSRPRTLSSLRHGVGRRRDQLRSSHQREAGSM
jgi:hypothetical protein